MNKIELLKKLVDQFDTNIEYYKNNKNAYNEHSCSIEYIDPFFLLFICNVADIKRLVPHY